MKMKLLPIFLIALMVLGSSGVYAVMQDNSTGAKTLYVSKNGTDRNDGLSSATAKRNIENALYAANSGDTIRVGPGIYATNLIINKDITLIGNNQEDTVIDGQQLHKCITIFGARVTITGFTIKNGVHSNFLEYLGGGIYNEGTLNLNNLTITDNVGDYGGGIYNNGVATLKGVTVKNNGRGSGGGGINNEGTMNIEDSIITDNSAKFGGGIDSSGTLNVTRVMIKNNNALCAGGIYTNGDLTVVDSIITNNGVREREIGAWKEVGYGMGGGIYNRGLVSLYGSNITNNNAGNNGGGIYNLRIMYIDDVTWIYGNSPTNFEGISYIPA